MKATQILPAPNAAAYAEEQVDSPAPLSVIEEIRSCQELIRKKTETLKTDLARQLDSACRMLALLQELGHKNVLREPQYYDFLMQLTSGIGELPKQMSRRVVRGDIAEALSMVLEEATTPLTENDLRKEVEKLMGRPVSALYRLLSRMCQRGAVAKTGSLYSLTTKSKTSSNLVSGRSENFLNRSDLS